ncbi:MAG: arginase [Proteobacteria bacterium]|nr:arginase [Pseudomonadota bacterium]
MLMQISAPALETRTVSILGAACGRGARDERCQHGPRALRQGGLIARLRHQGIDAVWRATLPAPSNETGIPALQAVSGLCKRLAARIDDLVAEGDFFAVLGGDHACAVGTWSGAARGLGGRGPLGLIWVDAHMDAHVPETSPSGTLHGMPVACLLGHGEEALTGFAARGPALRPEHICIIGVRSFEHDEAAFLGRLGVRVIFMEEIVRRGLDAVMDEALGIAVTGTAGFGVSIDLDALDPFEAPGVGSPVPHGLRGDALIPALDRLRRRSGFIGIEIAEFNPALDGDGVTARLINDLLIASIPARPAP